MMRVLGLILIVSAAAGCGDKPRSSVHGTVRWVGKPVSSGCVIFLAPDNMTYLADIQKDGSYKADGVPRGPLRVSVQQPPPRPAPRPLTAPDRSKDAPDVQADDRGKKARQTEPAPIVDDNSRLPEKYADPAQSGLDFELTEPDQSHDIELK